MKKIVGIGILMLLFPWLVSLAWTGTTKSKQEAIAAEVTVKSTEEAATKADKETGTNQVEEENQNQSARILVERNGIKTYIDLEDYLPGVIVYQIPSEYDLETLKCQAVIARTYIHRLMEGRRELWEEELDLDYLSENQRTLPWDKEKTAANLERCRQAVEATTGVVMQYENRDILPLFHAISAGRTRTGEADYPYLIGVESQWDTMESDYLQTAEWGLSDFANKINQIPEADPVTVEQLPAQMQTVKKDDAGYVLEMKIGAKTYTGEEVQYALGLSSSCFSLEGNQERIRAVIKGSGHGYGFSQTGADAMAKDGWGYEEILNYYYKKISIISA